MNERIVKALTVRYTLLMGVLVGLCVAGYLLFGFLSNQSTAVELAIEASTRQRMYAQNIILLAQHLRETRHPISRDAAYRALERMTASMRENHRRLIQSLKSGNPPAAIVETLSSRYLDSKEGLDGGVRTFLDHATALTTTPFPQIGPNNPDFDQVTGQPGANLVEWLDAAAKSLKTRADSSDASRQLVERSFLFVLLTILGGSILIFMRPVTTLRRDLAERTRMEAELRRNWERYALALRGANDGLWDWDVEKGEVYLSPRMAEIIGTEAADQSLSPQQIFDFVHPDDAPEFKSAMLAHMRGDTDLFTCEFRVPDGNGGYRWILDRGVALRDASGAVYRMAGAVTDITERRQAEEELRHSLTEQEIIAEITHLALEPIPLDEILQKALDIVLSRHKFGMEERGSIFLAVDGGDRLEMTAQHNLAPALTETCSRIPFGYCMCGRAAQTREIVFANALDDRHEVRFDGIAEHGHYCVPIISGNSVLGVLNLYVPHGHVRNAAEERFVTTIAESIGGIILRKRALESLRESEARFRSVTHTASDAIVALDGRGEVFFWNERAEAMFGRPASEMMGRQLKDIIPSRHRENHAAGIARIAAGGSARTQGLTIETQALRRDGTEFPIELSVGSWTSNGETFFSGIIRDITLRKDQEQRLRELSQAVEQSPASVIITDAEGTIQYVNRRYVEVSGYDSEEVLGGLPDILEPGFLPSEDRQNLWKSLRAGREWRGEFQARRKSGEGYWEFGTLSPIRDPEGNITHFLSIMEDITLRKEYEQRLVQQATIDSLTGLPNRVLAIDRLSQAITRAQRSSNQVGLMFIDLDQFKKVNDTLGHAAGDALLKQAAERLRGCLRESDTVARLGGDEFTVVLADLDDALDAELVAQKVIDACKKPFAVEGHEVSVTASIGITIFPDDERSPQLLMRNADAAMYQAKREGRNTFRFFTSEMNERAMEHLRMEENLRRAIEREELSLRYQPLVDNTTGRIIGAEALLRWNNPRLGEVSPERLIPLAEETGLIIPIGEWVLGTACCEAARWNRESPTPLTVAVNVSGRQFEKGRFVEYVRATLDECDLPASCLELEITENVLLENSQETADIIEELSAMGVRFSIDDFGTGYSSLSYLKKFPFHTLKIDRSFMHDVAENENAASLVQSIVAMARSMQLKVIGEGVETTDQRRFLDTLGCDLSQGWLFGKPLPPESFNDLLTRRHRFEVEERDGESLDFLPGDTTPGEAPA